MRHPHRLLALLLTCLTLVAPAQAATLIAYTADSPRGTIIVDTSARRLYFVLGHGQALQYPVGVGREGKQWSGLSHIDGRFSLPNWAPPAAIRLDKPELPAIVPGGAANNPMGAAAMTLAGGSYAIHGTNSPQSIGGFVSYGCIRMLNADILDLMSRVHIGTPVEVRL